VGSSHVWCFGRKFDSDRTCPGDLDAGLDLCGKEALAAQGYISEAQNSFFLKDCRPQDMMELAGNAFNACVVSACITSMMAVAPWSDIFDSDRSGSTIADEEGEEEEELITDSPVSTPDVDIE